MSQDIERGKVGASFEDFLKEQGTYEETSERAVKRVLAFQLAEEMKAKGFTKVFMAKKLGTSRSQLDRLLDPNAENVTLQALANVARQLGRTLHLELR
jgi:DNA-binding phage protein